jgi:hypothetical protein
VGKKEIRRKKEDVTQQKKMVRINHMKTEIKGYIKRQIGR